jgi:hypothetical protein
MTRTDRPLIDILMCVGPGDVHRLMPYSIESCLNYFELLNDIIIVTPAKAEVLSVIEQRPSLRGRVNITVLEDGEVVPADLQGRPGWCKQQFIRLHADRVCHTPTVACLSADTIICKPIVWEHLFSGSSPILFYNRYPRTSKHLLYERRRVENVARLLQVKPERSWGPGDFIMDFMLFESSRLQQLRQYLFSLYGREAFANILPGACDTLEERVAFGEWTLYAVFTLDVLGAIVELRNSNNRFVAQVHSHSELAEFHFDAHVVHFVDKSFDISTILTAVKAAENCRRRV